MKITIIDLQNKLSLHQTKIKQLVRKILRGEKINKSGWLNICFVNNRMIKNHNKKFHKTSGSTDVLAFDSGSKQSILADIMISTDTAVKQAHDFKTSSEYELSLYVAHGILHILGYNDQTAAQIKLMRKKENTYVHR